MCLNHGSSATAMDHPAPRKLLLLLHGLFRQVCTTLTLCLVFLELRSLCNRSSQHVVLTRQITTTTAAAAAPADPTIATTRQ
jgi:hypothetical protein